MLKNHKLSDTLNVTVGVGILSWKSHKTLEKSLESYEKLGFKDLFDEVKIIFQEISEDDKKLAQKYGYNFVGTDLNLGIQKGHQLIFENLNTNYILVLENDNPLIENQDIMKATLIKSIELLKSNKIDLMRLRHRWQFGESFSLEKYLDYYNVSKLHEKYIMSKLNVSQNLSAIKTLKKLFRRKKALKIAGYGIYFEKEPEKKFPKYIEKLDNEIFAVSSEIMTWTNQSVLLKKDFYGNLLDYAYNNPSSRTANGFQDLEKPLNCSWWRKRKFRIGICDGIFTHNRFDDSWRIEHHAFNKKIKNS